MVWQTKKWSEVVDIISGKNQKAVANPAGKYPIYGSGGIMGYADNYLCDAGTTIVGRKGTINNPIFVTSRFWNVDTAFGISPKEMLVPKYLYYFCRYFNFSVLDKSTTIPSLAKRDLLAIEMPVPTTDEQERIVARIEELFSQLDNGVETLQKTKQQLAVYRQAVLGDVFNGIGDCKTDIIQSVCSNIVDCPHSTPKWEPNGRICLRTTNFKRGYLDLSEKNYVSEEAFSKRNSRLTPTEGDVLYSREGAILGIACIIPKGLDLCLGQRMMLLRPNDRMLARFLMHYLNSPGVTAFVASKISGSASPHINVRDIKNFIVPVPPIPHQKQLLQIIDNRISSCNKIEVTIDDAIKQAEAMRQSILKKAFEGKLS